MNNQITWQDRFNVGVDFIDKEHKKLFSILNRLFQFGEDEEKSQWVYQEGIKYFKKHAMKHFAEEEAYMASIDYSGFEMHRQLHNSFRKKTLPEIEKEMLDTNFSEEAVKHFLGVCAGWLIGHTLTEDRAITGKAVSKWANLLPEDEQAEMGKVIIQLVYELFQLDARVISESYGGEKFGKGIYYRMAYVSDKGDKWEVMLVFEERLLVNTVGKLMGNASDKVNVMMMNATRYVSRQFVDRIRMRIPDSEKFELKEENLLSYEQFQRIFGRQSPQCSLLFDTGEGYFAYCAVAPHLLNKNGLGASIHAGNAMTEIKKYLDGNEAEGKKKVLVVDGNDSVRQSMEGILGKDYNILLAKSGMSALRSIILDRPDLVLLDFDMPDCEGRQVLEMIRKEEDFAEIPVILTASKVDKDGLKDILSLKPAGYLLKNQSPENIKQSVDSFFKK